jgi:hypothetical protein
LDIALAIIAILYLIKSKYREGLQLLSIVGITVLLLFGYCKQIEAKTGVFVVTGVKYNNEFVIAYNIGKLTPENVSDSTIRQRVIDFEKKNCREDIWDIPDIWELPLKQKHDEIQRIKSQDIVGWYTKTLIDNLKRDSAGSYRISVFHIVYLLIIILGVAIAVDWYRKRECPIIPLLLWLMCTGNTMVNLLGSFAEWGRLFLPSMPMLIMLTAWIFTKVKICGGCRRQLR